MVRSNQSVMPLEHSLFEAMFAAIDEGNWPVLEDLLNILSRLTLRSTTLSRGSTSH